MKFLKFIRRPFSCFTMTIPAAISIAMLAGNGIATRLGSAHAAENGREARFGGGQWQRGQMLYQRNCAQCHGANLAGRCMAPSLMGVTGHMTDAGIVAHARKIGDTMCCARHIRNLGDAEFADIVAFFHAADRDPTKRPRTGGGGGCCCSR